MTYNFYQTIICHSLSKFIPSRVNIDLLVLYYLVRFFRHKKILEVGFLEGKTFAALLEASTPNSLLTALDLELNTNLFEQLYKNSDAYKQRTVSLLEQNSLDFTPTHVYDFISIDSSHVYPETLNEINKYVRHLSQQGILMLDDYAVQGVDRSIDEFMQHNRDWVPFLQGEQQVFFHHVSHDASEFLDVQLQVLDAFCTLSNSEYKGHVVKQVQCLPVITQNNDIFAIVCERYLI